MENNVKSFSVEYNPINKNNVFSCGDYIAGKITLELTNECKIEALCVKLKGKAEVKWTEHHGKTVITYHKKEKYFSIKQFLIPKGQGNNLIGKGCHVYPFTLQIPTGDLPSSFRGKFGKIVYTLEGNLSRSMRMDSKAKAPFTFINKETLKSDPGLMIPQHSMIDQKMRLFTSGEVAMEVNIPHTGFRQGEGIQVVASIQNKSSRDIKPKYCLYQKYSYFAKGKRKIEKKDILKEVGEAIPRSAGQTVTRLITVPATTCASILNCNIIKAEYRLRVYLDVKFASDPEIKFNIVILPALEGSDGEQPPPYFGSETFPSVFASGASYFQNTTDSVPSAPPAYMSYGVYPSLSGLSVKPYVKWHLTGKQPPGRPGLGGGGGPGHTLRLPALIEVPLRPSEPSLCLTPPKNMSTTVKKLEVTYNPINDSNTFTNGDIVTGQVTLEVAKDCQIDSLSIKFKGKAEVLWSERHGQVTVVYHSKDKYFSIKQYFIRDKNIKDDEKALVIHNPETYCSVVAPGVHVYPFTFQIPSQEMPSSFKGADGKIQFLLEARLGRSMRIAKKESTKINFVSNAAINSVYGLMTPQHESKDKKMKLFTSGSVAMDVDLEKSGFYQGEGLKVLAFIKNDSSREIKPKYCIYSKHSFFARGKRRVHTYDLIKEVGAPIPPSTSEKVTQIINVPHDAEPSILNCSILKAEYRLRVYLDVKYASDPEIKFDIVIMPASQAYAVALAPPPAPTSFGFEPLGNPNPPVWGLGPPQPPAVPQFSDQPPPPYGAYAMYPSLNEFTNK
ncbi:uncharacterized protein ACNS7B_011754 [Menidia menidia]